MLSFNPSSLLTKVANFQGYLADLSRQAASLSGQLIPWVKDGVIEQSYSNLSIETRDLAESLHSDLDSKDLVLQKIRDERNKNLTDDEIKVLEKIYSHYSATRSNGQDRMPLLNNLLSALGLEPVDESTRNQQRKNLYELFTDSIARNEHRFCFPQKQQIWQNLKTHIEEKTSISRIPFYSDLKANKYAVIDGICGTIGRRIEATNKKKNDSEKIISWDKSLWMQDEVIEIAVKTIAHLLRA